MTCFQQKLMRSAEIRKYVHRPEVKAVSRDGLWGTLMNTWGRIGTGRQCGALPHTHAHIHWRPVSSLLPFPSVMFSCLDILGDWYTERNKESERSGEAFMLTNQSCVLAQRNGQLRQRHGLELLSLFCLAAWVYRKDSPFCPLGLGAVLGLSPRGDNCPTSAATAQRSGHCSSPGQTGSCDC